MKICSIENCTATVYAKGYCKKHYVRLQKYGNADEPPRQSTAKTLAGKLSEGTPKGLPDDECWEWTKYRSDGYGMIPYGGKLVYAHRAAYEVANGVTIPTGVVVRHGCDNPPCVNLNHLKLGTQADNARDKMERGRVKTSRGERNGRARLTTDEVLRIRKMYSDGVVGDALAEEFGVSATAVRNIIHRRTWTHV